MGMLMLLGLTAVAGVGSGWYVVGTGLDDPNLEPKILGMNAGYLLGAIGTGLALLVGGPIGAIGAGLAIGGLVGGHGVAATKAGLQEMIKAQVSAALPMQPPAPPALPGPGAALPPPDPGVAPGALPGNALMDIISPPGAPATV